MEKLRVAVPILKRQIAIVDETVERLHKKKEMRKKADDMEGLANFLSALLCQLEEQRPHGAVEVYGIGG